jgi:hypothetical protein
MYYLPYRLGIETTIAHQNRQHLQYHYLHSHWGQFSRLSPDYSKASMA